MNLVTLGKKYSTPGEGAHKPIYPTSGRGALKNDASGVYAILNLLRNRNLRNTISWFSDISQVIVVSADGGVAIRPYILFSAR